MKKLQHSYISRLGVLPALLSLKAIDASSPEGRSRERLRRALLTSVTAAITRLVSMVGPLITVPIALDYLGRERYGLWMAVTSIVGMFAFADLGLGNGLLTMLSQADGRGDVRESRRCIASTLFALSGVGLILSCLYFLVFPFVSWAHVLNATSADLVHESGAVVTVCFVTFLLNLPLGVVQRTQFGLQLGFQSNCWQAVGSFINVAVVLTAVKLRATLPILVLCVTAVQPSVNLLNGFFFFAFQRRRFTPRLRDFHWPTARRLLATGFWYFLVSILMAIGIYSDNLVVAHVVGLKSVPLYSVPASLAAYLGTVASMLYLPFWSANGEALTRGDISWVRRNTARIVKLNVLITGTAGLAFIVAGPLFLHLWLGPQFSPGRWVFGGMAAWAFLVSAAGPLFMILNGANVVRVQVLMFAIFSFVAISLKLVLARRVGIAGVVWASVVPYACLVMPAVVLIARRVLSRAEMLSPRATEASALPLISCKESPTSS